MTGPLSEDGDTGMYYDETGVLRRPPLKNLHYHEGIHVSPEGWEFQKITACLIDHEAEA